ncbi:MAG TPA: sigma-70 family RNA polymerase sigma factor [Acidimicrobiia bacterium]|jgi:RNA polymerase sigma-70 factor (ECF subfamily)|nr:sigma-70 family RNA polymerase sigma factor [Acidimicrobiia bacterium]
MVMIQGESLGQRAGSLPPPHDELVLVDAPDADDTDNMLLARLRAGDELAFRALVDRHRPWLVRLCTRLLGHDAHAAEDAAQESLLKLHAAAQRGQPLRVRPWLTVVARNTCIDEQRRRRPDLPGELPERAVAGVDPFDLDAALSEAWSHLAGRHREVLYLREVLGFSYKEIGAVMGLSMAATETLVFRARAALKREYERSGGTSFGSALLGLQLARLGLDRRRDPGMAEGIANAAVNDPGFSSLTSRLAHFLSTSLPGCGEQAVAKVLTVAAGVVMAAASVIPGLNPFADGPAGAAIGGSATVSATTLSSGGPEASNQPVSLKTMLGNGVPADWAPQRSRTEAKPAPVAAPAPTVSTAPSPRITPLRDAAAATRSADRPTLNRPVRADSEPGPLRSILPARPQVEQPDRPTPLRSLLEAIPTLIDPLPVDPQPVDPIPTAPAPGEATPPEPAEPTPIEPSPVPEQGSRPSVRETAGSTKDAVPPGDDNVVGHDPALLRRRDR